MADHLFVLQVPFPKEKSDLCEWPHLTWKNFIPFLVEHFQLEPEYTPLRMEYVLETPITIVFHALVFGTSGFPTKKISCNFCLRENRMEVQFDYSKDVMKVYFREFPDTSLELRVAKPKDRNCVLSWSESVLEDLTRCIHTKIPYLKGTCFQHLLAETVRDPATIGFTMESEDREMQERMHIVIRDDYVYFRMGHVRNPCGEKYYLTFKEVMIKSAMKKGPAPTQVSSWAQIAAGK